MSDEPKNTPQFTHLHLHTEYSLLDGANKIKALAKKVKELGMTSVAMTDHGNMFGTIDFYNTMKKEGIKPICKKRTKPATLRVYIRPPLSLDIRPPVAEMIRPLWEKERDFIFV